MRALLYGMALRFLRQRVWVLAAALPAGAALVAAFRGTPAAGAAVVLASLHHLLPPLAAIFLVTGPLRAGLDLLRVRPVSWPELLLARWLGGIALFGGCHLLLAAGLAAALALSGAEPAAKVSRAPDARFLGETAVRPGDGILRPWPRRAPEARWLAAVGGGAAWSFAFSGLEPGRSHRLRLWPHLARILTDRSLTDPATGLPARELARASDALAQVRFGGGGREDRGQRVVLRDAGRVEIEVPPEAVGADGRLRVSLAPAGGQEAAEEGPVRWGPPFFWFEGGESPLDARDARVVVGEIPFSLNALGVSLEALGKLVLVAGLAVAASSFLRPGVALAVVLCVYAGASALPFLEDILAVLSSESAASLMEDAASHHHADGSPGGFEHGLEVALRFWLALLPDFARLEGSRLLEEGESLPPALLLRSAAVGVAYAAVFLGGAALFSWRGRASR